MTTDNKQPVLTDEQNAIIASHFPTDPANACRAHAAVTEILPKLRGVGGPSDDRLLFTMRNLEPHLKDVDAAVPVLISTARALLSRYAAPQASADPSHPAPASSEDQAIYDRMANRYHNRQQRGGDVGHPEHCQHCGHHKDMHDVGGCPIPYVGKYIAPVAAQKAEDARDAQRWREWLPWMRNLNRKPFNLAMEIRKIDAAIAQQGKEGT